MASCVNSEEVFVDIQSPSAYAGNDTTVLYGEEAPLDADGGVDYSWSPSTYLDDPNSENPICTPEATTTYTVTVTTDIGCVFTDQVTVFVLYDAEVYVPGAFSPNDDNVNDVFYAEYLGAIGSWSLNIYNRWGELVFSSTDPVAVWNGKVNDEPQPMGTYVYVLNYADLDGDAGTIQGNVVLVR